MRVIVLHGEDSAKSYDRLSKFMETAKSRGWEIIYDTLPVTPSLFGSDRLVVFRDFHNVTDNDIKNFDKFGGTVVVYYDAEIPAGFIKKMPASFKMEKFDIPKILFAFLENLYPGNATTALKMFHEIIRTDPVELVFFFIAKHFRDLYWVAESPKSTGFPDWKNRKLAVQSAKYPNGKIKEIIKNLAEMDFKVKTGGGELTPLLDLLIIKQLE